MTISRRGLLAAIGATAATNSIFSSAFANVPYPQNTVRVVVPFPPGGPTDIVGRVVSQRLTDLLKKPFVVDNRAGASGIIGSDIVAKAQPDGLTLLVNVSAQVINPYLYPKLPNDPFKDFAPITNLASTPIQLVVSADVPVKNVDELVAYVKAHPGKCSFASSSAGAPGHLAGEVFKLATRSDAQHVPYKGSAPALTDVMSGQVTYMFDSMPSSIGFVKGGKLRALGVTGTSRAPSLPDVPTMAESGYPDMTMTSWYGFWAPARTPSEIIERLQKTVAQSLLEPAVVKQLTSISAEPMGDSPSKFAEFCQSEARRYESIIKAANIKLS